MKNVIELYNNPQVDDELYQRLADDLVQGIDLSLRKTMLKLERSRPDSLPRRGLDEISKVVLKHFGKDLRKVERLGRRVGGRRVDEETARHPVFGKPPLSRAKGTALYELKRYRSYTQGHPRAYRRLMRREYGYARQLFAEASREHLHESIDLAQIIPVAPEPDTPPYTSLTFQLHKVYCNEETDDPGKDEIVMGGVAIDEFGRHGVNKFKVKNFHTDDKKEYVHPEKKFYQFPIQGEPAEFPKGWAVTVAMAEKDWGGFGDFLVELWVALESHVQEILIDAGVAVGGSIAGPLGAVIAGLVCFLVGWIVGFIIELAQDDVFEPRLVMIGLPSSLANFGGSERSPIQKLKFRGHGGKYTVKYSWLLSK